MINADSIGERVRCFGGVNREATFYEGVVIGYCPAPMVIIEDEMGVQRHWRADLTELVKEKEES